MASYYSDPATLALQREAIKRVKEMQQRAQSSVERPPQNQSPPPANSRSADQPPQNAAAPPSNMFSQLFGTQQQNRQPRRPQPPPKGIAELLKRQGLGDSLGGMGKSIQDSVSSVSQPIADILESFGIDGEKLIILMVMWAVFNEQRDNKTLLLALGYLLI